MNVLLVNKFLYPRGGDAICTLATGRLLQRKGHQVSFWGMDHPDNLEFPLKEHFVRFVDYNQPGGWKKQLRMALSLLYSIEAKNKIKFIIQKEKPDVIHLNNFAHQISPSILHAIRRYRLPVVATLHDSKLVCASYLLRCKDDICEACAGGKYYYCLIKKCVKASLIKSLLSTSEMYLHHKLLHLYGLVDTYISPSLFLKNKIEEMGFRGNIVHLPNFIHINDYRPCYNSKERSIVYFGRISEEKGLRTLLRAVAEDSGYKVKIIGDGPLKSELEQMARQQKLSHIQFLGYLTGKDLAREVTSARLIIVPSECHENHPLAIIEAFAMGKPVIGSQLGGIPELVVEGQTGLTFRAKDAGELRTKINTLLNRPDLAGEMGRKARCLVEDRFNAERYYDGLMKIYRAAIARQSDQHHKTDSEERT